jgi:hypothetical protein
MSIENNDVISEMFAERVSNPLIWFKHSRSLLAAARATKERAEVLIDVWEKSDLDNVATMLYGFSIENLFKALWTFKKFGAPHTNEWIPAAEFPDELKTHDLTKLSLLIDKRIAEDYDFSLSMLTDTTIWAGRYPCSIKGNEGSIGRFSDKVHTDAEYIFKIYSKPFTSIC